MKKRFIGFTLIIAAFVSVTSGCYVSAGYHPYRYHDYDGNYRGYDRHHHDYDRHDGDHHDYDRHDRGDR